MSKVFVFFIVFLSLFGLNFNPNTYIVQRALFFEKGQVSIADSSYMKACSFLKSGTCFETDTKVTHLKIYIVMRQDEDSSLFIGMDRANNLIKMLYIDYPIIRKMPIHLIPCEKKIFEIRNNYGLILEYD